MIELYFGLPRCGKTTMIVSKVRKISRNITDGRSKYKKILGNVDIVGVPHYQKITFDMLGRYATPSCAIFIDEATIEADSRQFKAFQKYTNDFLMLHGHWGCDLFFFCQIFDAVDRRIRLLTENVFYMFKLPIVGRWFTHYYRIPFSIVIPDPRKNDTEKFGEIVSGYHKPSLFERLLTLPLFRPSHYPFFDTHQTPELPPLPEIGFREGEVIPFSDFDPLPIPTHLDISIRSYF